MIKNSDIVNYGFESALWCVGANNYAAIGDVWSNKYNYNDADAASTTKIKQTGTEILHAGLKLTTLATLVDRTIFHFTSIDSGLSKHLPFHFLVPDLSTLWDSGPDAIGMLSFMYTLPLCLKNLSGAKKSCARIIQTDYEGDFKFSRKDILDTIEKLANTCILFHCTTNYGLNGATLAAPLLYLSTNHEKMNSSIGKIVKSAIVIGSIPSIPVAGPYIMPLVRGAFHIIGGAAKMVGF